MKLDQKRIYLMMEIKKRELDARLYFACKAADKGYSAVVAPKSRIYQYSNFLKPGINVFKSLGTNNSIIIKKLRSHGHKCVAWDEEAFVTSKDMNANLKMRFVENNMRKIEYFFAWGKSEKKILTKHFKKFKDKIKITGNSRVDVLKKPISKIYNQEVKRLKEKYGNFVLFFTNFARINHITFDAKNVDEYLRRVSVHDIKKGDKNYEYLQGMVKFQSNNFDKLSSFFKKFSKSFPKKKLIIRCHPSEKIETYEKLVKSNKNIHIISDDESSIAWIGAADISIASNCTTSVESYIYNKLSINYLPFRKKKYHFLLPEKLSINAYSDDQAIKCIKEFYKKKYENYLSILKKKEDSVKKSIYNIDKNICSVTEMLKYMSKIELKKSYNDKNSNRIFFYYLIFKRFIKRIFESLGLIKYSEHRLYLMGKIPSFNHSEVLNKMKKILPLMNLKIDDFELKQIYPEVFEIKKK